ncbi:sensor histidine kinase [Oerskovia flava]|uniref:sensor histidine kinase n=1 Tax=Oerskovia flava TaxID=2986422 RepID=UPI00223FDCBE|nr:histidine kinase [Oerskovia sp. JB1-3-2]
MRVPGNIFGVWQRSSDPERFDAYTRWSLYVLSACEVFLVLWVVGLAEPEPSRPALLGPLLIVALVHTVACIGLLRSGITQFLGGPSAKRWVLGAAVALGVLGIVLSTLTYPGQDAAYVDGNTRVVLTLVFAGFTVAACAPLLAFRWLTVGAVGIGGLVAGVHLLGADRQDGTAVGVATGQGFALMIVCFGAFLSYRASIWMDGVVWEQERTRVLHARLAVAEERLRFSRDLHDVFGRTLSVVAVKSELAAELTARGRPGAEEQMLEVRQIAQEALREVRSVVAGYRSADLAAELAGARSVLRSAGIDTTVTGEDVQVGKEAQEALAWVVREGVTNVVRHSAAATCRVELRRDADGAVLEIVNDGVTSPPGRGSGLVGLSERLAGVRGELTTWYEDERFGLVARVPDRAPTPTYAPSALEKGTHA